MRIEQLTVGWDDPTQVNWDEPEQSTSEVVEPPAAPLYKCTALYSYVVSGKKLFRDSPTSRILKNIY